MSKRSIISIVLACAVVAAIAAAIFLQPEVRKIDVSRGGPAAVTAVPQILTKSFNEETGSYAVRVEYPELQGLAPGMAERINGDISAAVNNQIAGFRSMNAANSTLGDPELKSSFDGRFEVVLLTKSFFSGLMSYSDYSSGAAHANSYNMALNYNLKTGEEVILDQFLRSLNASQGYMDRLVQYVKRDLIRQFGNSQDSLDAINFGAAPNPENYANFTLDNNSLAIHFDPYQVAPYAAGSPVVKIAYDSLISQVVKPSEWRTASSTSADSLPRLWWLE